jgi:hypothetical protein
MIITINDGATVQVVQITVSGGPFSIASVTGLTTALAAKASKAAPVFTSVPTSDPASAGAVWSNGGVLMISAG